MGFPGDMSPLSPFPTPLNSVYSAAVLLVEYQLSSDL